jgi:hypothetical protein
MFDCRSLARSLFLVVHIGVRLGAFVSTPVGFSIGPCLSVCGRFVSRLPGVAVGGVACSMCRRDKGGRVDSLISWPGIWSFLSSSCCGGGVLLLMGLASDLILLWRSGASVPMSSGHLRCARLPSPRLRLPRGGSYPQTCSAFFLN